MSTDNGRYQSIVSWNDSCIVVMSKLRRQEIDWLWVAESSTFSKRQLSSVSKKAISGRGVLQY